MRSPRDLRTWLPIATFVSGLSLPLLVYYLTLAPDLTWAHGGDGGDLIVAAYTLGISHPPGYPAYTLLAHLFTLLPWGSVAFRVNLLSAMGAAVAAGSVALAVSALSARERKWDVLLGAVVAAWGLAFMPLLWRQAVIAEVYAVHAAFVALTIWLALRLNNRPTTWAALILGLVWGIAFGFHLTSIFLLPIIIWGLSRHIEKTQIFRLWGGLSVGFGVAFLQWLYIALRAGRGAVTWGNPTTLDGWWWLISGSLYRGYVFSFPLEGWLPRLFYLAKSLLTGLGPIAVLLGLVGWAFLARRRSGLALALGTTAIAYVVFAIGYNTIDSDNYTIPALVAFCIAVGCGAVQAIDEVRAQWGHGALVAGWTVIFLMLALSVLFHWSSVSLVTDQEATLFGKKVMQTVPDSAVLLTDDDRATFTLWYFRYVLEQRTDTLIVDKGLLAFDWYQAELGITPAEATLIVNRNEVSSLRPVCQVIVENQSPVIDCPQDHSYFQQFRDDEKK
ncbi:MAG: DUF2723 domain-containing protein [Nanoarchaeota archaeon]|nr:DUF2723 domain-containing protein [Nanoarchaeota archaeon]